MIFSSYCVVPENRGTVFCRHGAHDDYDPMMPLDESRDDAVSPHPFHLRDTSSRPKLDLMIRWDRNLEVKTILGRSPKRRVSRARLRTSLSVRTRKAPASS